MQQPDDLPPRGGILMGLQSGVPAKWLSVPRRSVRIRAEERRLAGVGGGSPGNSPPAGETRETPSACDTSIGGPVLSSAQGSLRVITLADGGPRPLTRADLLYVRSEPVPLFVHFLQAFFSFLPWLHRALSCGVLLLMRRLHLFVLRLFLTCEDFRLRSAPDITFSALSEFTAESWQALLHLSTSPVPQVGKVDPQLVERGLGAVGNYTISDELWCELAPPDFEASVSDFHLERESRSSTREALVLPMVKWLLREGVVSIMDEGCPMGATCWPFVIPKSTEKGSLIFNLVEFNESLHKPLSFSLDGWEQISQRLAEWPADRPLFCTHVDLKNAFWSFKLPRRHERAFRFRVRWEGVERVFCMSRMPFGWKHSPLFCQTALGRIVRPLVPEGYILFHYLDDFFDPGAGSSAFACCHCARGSGFGGGGVYCVGQEYTGPGYGNIFPWKVH